jgi:hypothetical protein
MTLRPAICLFSISEPIAASLMIHFLYMYCEKLFSNYLLHIYYNHVQPVTHSRVKPSVTLIVKRVLDLGGYGLTKIFPMASLASQFQNEVTSRNRITS